MFMKGHRAKYDLAEFWQAVFGTQHPKEDIIIIFAVLRTVISIVSVYTLLY